MPGATDSTAHAWQAHVRCASQHAVPTCVYAGLRVLVVDDDPLCLKITEQMLKRCNYEGAGIGWSAVRPAVSSCAVRVVHALPSLLTVALAGTMCWTCYCFDPQQQQQQQQPQAKQPTLCCPIHNVALAARYNQETVPWVGSAFTHVLLFLCCM
jgi:hypothetical protein